MRVFFDLDGTLCDTPSDANWEESRDLVRRCRPRPVMLNRVLELAAMGHHIGLITARGPHCRADTRQQMVDWLGKLGGVIPIHHRPGLVFDWDSYVKDKETAMRKECVDVYVGDRAEDKAAALRAGARFLWDYEFHEYGLTPLRGVYA